MRACVSSGLHICVYGLLCYRPTLMLTEELAAALHVVAFILFSRSRSRLTSLHLLNFTPCVEMPERMNLFQLYFLTHTKLERSRKKFVDYFFHFFMFFIPWIFFLDSYLTWKQK